MNERLASGYDVVVWKDEDDDVVCCAYTKEGARWLRTMYPKYRKGQILQIIASPEQFSRRIPHDILVGRYTTDTHRVLPLEGVRLQ